MCCDIVFGVRENKVTWLANSGLETGIATRLSRVNTSP